MFDSIRRLLLPGAALLVLLSAARMARAAEPPVINPFGAAPSLREDAIPGYVEMSDGTVHPGHIHLTRDKKLKVYDDKLNRQREVPLRVVEQIECKVKKEWMEKEWKFKEAASSQKMYTGRTYPAREYLHTITLRGGRTISGPLSAIVYVQPSRLKTERYLLHKRDKGKIGQKLESLAYVKLIKLGEEALREGRQKAAKQRSQKKHV